MMYLIKKNIVLFLLIPIVIISQIILLKPHLKYGFSDVDWTFLSIYKTQNPYSLSQFIKNIKVGGTAGGVYTHQIYYMGIQADLFGLNFESFQKTTHIFKILAILFSFPIFLAISGNLLIAFIATLFFGFSYSSVGTMYTIVTSSDYLAIFSMELFLLTYWYTVKKSVGNWFWLFFALILLILTLFFSTERMYPLPLFVLLIEIFLFSFKVKKFNGNTVKRIIVLFLPIILIFLTQPLIFLDFFLRNGVELIQRITAGNWNLILTPFISLGSILVSQSLTEFSGLAKFNTLYSYLDFLISGPLPILVFITILVGIGVFRRPIIFILKTFILMTIFSIILYILSTHYLDHLINIESISQAFAGMYLLTVSFVSFGYWIKERDQRLIGLFCGPLMALLYIILTWLGAATSEVFVGAHRYLTIPSMGISIFIATLVAISFQRMFSSSQKFVILKIVSFIPFVFLLYFIQVNVKGVEDFFSYQLYNGFGAADQQYMRANLSNYLTNLSNDRPSLFYFDFREDNNNSYYYDNTIRGAFPIWMLWNSRINFNKRLEPDFIWNQPEILKSSVSINKGIKGLEYNGKFYDKRDFYAFKLQNRQIFDIKSEIMIDLGI